MTTVKRELILNPAEIEVSIECKTCQTRIQMTLQGVEGIEKQSGDAIRPPDVVRFCPFCHADWKPSYDAIRALRNTLDNLANCGVALTAPYPESDEAKKGT